MSSWVTPAIASEAGPVRRDTVEVRSGMVDMPRWSWLSAAPSTQTGAFFVLRARSADVTTTAAPASVTRQQSNRWKGHAIHRESW